MKYSNLLTAAVALAVTAFVVTSAPAQQKGAACFHNCRADLKQRGLWSSYPYGYCRKKCDYWVGENRR